MSASSRSEIHLHFTWHTKANARLITAEVKTKLYAFLVSRATREQGVTVHAVGGTEDHAHLAVRIPPTLTISRWIGELKGASAHYLNRMLLSRQSALEWQQGYGVVSFSASDIPRVVAYIGVQVKQHSEREWREKAEGYRGPLASNRT